MKTLLIAGALASLAQAADLKPLDTKMGLWETTTTRETEGMPAMPTMPQIPKETLDKMPAAQRAKVEEMMKGRANLGGPQTMVTKACMTKESVARSYEMPTEKNVDCKREVISSTSSHMQMHMVCSMAGAAASKGVGASVSDVAWDRIDSEHTKGTMVSKTDVQGKTMTMKMAFTSKWLGADCGDVKPLTAK